MSPAAEILVVILSIFLALFLLLGITLTVYLIILTRQIRNVTKSAERTVQNFESAVSGFTKVVSPIFIAELIKKYIKKFKKGNKEK